MFKLPTKKVKKTQQLQQKTVPGKETTRSHLNGSGKGKLMNRQNKDRRDRIKIIGNMKGKYTRRYLLIEELC